MTESALRPRLVRFRRPAKGRLATGTCWLCLGFAVLTATSGCGYRILDPAAGGGRRMAVPTSKNQSRWRGLEGDFTRFLRADMQRQLDIRLDHRNTDLKLLTEIRDIGRSAPVRDRQTGGASLGTSRLEVLWTLQAVDGSNLAEGRIERSLEFLPADGESAYDALAEILDSAAEQVVMEVGMQLASLTDKT